MPSRRPSRIEGGLRGRSNGATVIIMSVTIAATLLTPLTRKQVASLEAAMSTPAMVGPIMRPPFCIRALKAMAPGRSSRVGTISGVNDCRTGMSTAMITPKTPAMTTTCQTSTASE